MDLARSSEATFTEIIIMLKVTHAAFYMKQIPLFVNVIVGFLFPDFFYFFILSWWPEGKDEK